MQPMHPLLVAFLAGLFGSIMAFAFNLIFRRTGRRNEWYEQMDALVRDIQNNQAEILRRCRDLEDIKLPQRISELEWKIGSWYRLVETHMTDFLKPPVR